LAKTQFAPSDRAAKLFIEVLYQYRTEQKYRLHEFVVMPNHVHVLITVDHTISVERAVQLIKGGFSFRAGKELGFRAPVWERGFSEVRVSEGEAAAGIREYIQQNPVVARLERTAAEYKYGSAYPGFYLDELPQGLKPVPVVVGVFGTSKDVP
jgi:putative transposase